MQKVEIGEAIEKLFMLQDRPLSEKKKLYFANELCQYGFPFKAILLGLNSLLDAELRQIKIVDIRKATERFVSYKFAKTYQDCEFCDKTGFITMLNFRGNEYAFACKCVKGKDVADDNRIYQWNGNKEQMFNGKVFRLRND
jgi:hypothetical protein